MYQSAQGDPGYHLDNFTPTYPSPPDFITSAPTLPSVGYETRDWPGRGHYQPADDESDEAIILVHGWNMDDPDRRTFSETFFKRLWWKGFKGRFCSFAWPTYNKHSDFWGYIPDHYNKSEYIAWKYGPSLKAYVDGIPKSSKNIAAHSMGNVVAASALLLGLRLQSYVAMEAAIPASAYDSSFATSNYQPFVTEESWRPTPDLAISLGYRGLMENILGESVRASNFYSANDFALKTGITHIVGIDKRTNWESNQIEHKPNHLLNYAFYPSAVGSAKNRIERIVGESFVEGRDVTDHHEAMSFIARPRSEALGVRNTAPFKAFDLADPSHRYPFGTDRAEHSGQFERPIQKTHFFYNALLHEMGVGFVHLAEKDL